MTPERWREIDELYQAALALPPADRAALLAEATPELRRKVDSMLAQPSGGGLLDRRAGELLEESAITPLTAGTLLGPYKIESFLGAGGMGQVFQAVDTRLGRKVAVKVAHDQFSARFSREAQAISTLNHPHICTLHDVGSNYLVMELVEGETLAAKLKKGALPIEQTLRYGAEIAEALAEAHGKGIVHRDLKPGNIMISKNGVKVLDFGLAKSPGDQNLTDSKAMMGTPAYMAPEQMEGKAADARMDIYALGLVLREMATGRRTPGVEALPAQFEHVVERCLAPEPESRWQSANDVKAELEWAAKVQPAAIVAKPSRHWPWVAAATVLLGVLAGLFAWQSRRPSEQLAFRLQLEPPEGGRFVFGQGPEGGVALSADGKTAAYIVERGGKTELWIRPLDGTNARPLAGTDGAARPFWSPDSRSVAFFSSFASGNKLLRVELVGGAPVPICDVPGAALGGAWSEDGRIIFASFASSGLLEVPASGGQATLLTRLDSSRGELFHGWPQALPGGRFLYSIKSTRQENTGVFVASFTKSTERTRLTTADSLAVFAPGGDGKDYLLWNRGSAVVAQQFDLSVLKLVAEPRPVAEPVSNEGSWAASAAGGALLYASRPAPRRLMWLDRSGKPLGEAGEPGDYFSFRISPEGSRVALARFNDTKGLDLWVLEATRGISNRLTSNPGGSHLPVWSPDGRRIVFSYGTPFNLYLREASGAGTQQRLTDKRTALGAEDWSRDGRFILYFETGYNTQVDLWVLPMTPDGKPSGDPQPYLRTRFNEAYGRFSPEPAPRWVAYVSDESGPREVYVQSFPQPHGARRISTAGGDYPQWNANGRELFYVSADNKLMAVSLRVNADSVEPSPPRELFNMPSQPRPHPGMQYDAAPDGRRFLVQGPEEQRAQPLTVIVNWPALLKRGSATQ